MRPLIHADQKQKRVNFRTENLSDMERKMKKRLATNWKPELYPENENSKLDINPAAVNGITPENQMAILQHLLRMKSQGTKIPEYRMNMVRVNALNNYETINYVEILFLITNIDIFLFLFHSATLISKSRHQTRICN